MDVYEKSLMFLLLLHFLWFVQMNELQMLIRSRRRRMIMIICNRKRQMMMTAELMNFARMMLTIQGLPRPTRQLWRRARSQDWWERIVLQTYTDKQWMESFRMRRQTFNVICDLTYPYMKHADNLVIDAVPFEKRVALAIYKIASCAENRVVSDVFGVHRSTVVKYVKMFCETMVKYIMPQIIVFPDEQEAKEIAARVEAKTLFPQAAGFIDGTHIPITAPSDGYRDFINRKLWPSYVLQAVVDDRLRFRDISCKMPGSAHDANVLKVSSLFKRAENLPLKSTKTLTYKIQDENNRVVTISREVPLQILGDPAYPLLPWLLKGFVGSGCLPEEETFNVFHSSARVAVETAFGRLKGRWRMLQKKMDVHHTFVPYVVATACILHNIVEDSQETYDTSLNIALQQHQREYPNPRSRPCSGVNAVLEENRKAVMYHLFQNYGRRESFKTKRN